MRDSQAPSTRLRLCGWIRGSHRFLQHRLSPVAAAKTRRRYPARFRASAPPGEPHWACSAPTSSGSSGWEAQRSRPAARPRRSRLHCRGWRRRLVRSRCCQPSGAQRGAAAARRLAMARSARRPPEWRGSVRLAGAPGESGPRGASSWEHGTGWAVLSWLRLSPRNFICRLGWGSPGCSLSAWEEARSRQQAPGVAGCFKISAGRDPVVADARGDSSHSGSYHKPPTAWKVVSTARYRGALKVYRGKGRKGATGAFAWLQAARVTVPQFPRNRR